MTETRIKKIGFKEVNRYTHDEWNTIRYQKGVIFAEFTYLENKLDTIDIYIDEINGIEVSEDELKQLDSILNQ